MLALTHARRSYARSLLWLLSLVSAFALVGTWAVTPELAQESLARDVSATAVPPQTIVPQGQQLLRFTRPTAPHAGGHAGARAGGEHWLDASPSRPYRLLALDRGVAPAAGAPIGAPRGRNRAPYHATAPPAAS